MPDRSSISNSEQEGCASRRGSRVRAVLRRVPSGAVWAVVLVSLVHLAGPWCLDQPVAREALRRKAKALTARASPSLVLAGDSRARAGLIPSVFAGELGLPASQVVNISETACDSSAVLFAYREFSSRFAERPVLLLGVSVFSVNDGADQLIGDELLWGLSLWERSQLVSPGRVIASCFLPEKAVWNTCTSWLIRPAEAPVVDGGYCRMHRQANIAKWSPQARRGAVQTLSTQWYDQPCVNGVRWGKLDRDLQAFVDAGMYLVVVDPPHHPAVEAYADPQVLQADRQFREQLAQLASRLRIPLLSCPPDWYGRANPDLLFYDLVHLNGAGAELYSRLIASRVTTLADSGAIRLDARRPPIKPPLVATR